ncbi:MAG TPA: hypothetical protein VFO23_02565 [Steroidobacteraceae bacterium]|nr:hypothetical protein [Steroidobacteraceae bacterium]
MHIPLAAVTWRAVVRGGAACLAAVLLLPAAAAEPPALSAAAAAAIGDANAQWLPAMKRADVAAIVAVHRGCAVRDRPG